MRKQIVDLYLRAFRKTPLVFMSDDAEVLNYALAHGTGFRRDGVGSPWHEQNWIGSKKYAGVAGMADTWKRAPVVFEWFGDYDYLQSRQWSFDAAVNFMLSNHVTLINDNIGRVPPEAMPQLEKLARLAGARFVLRELAHEKNRQTRRAAESPDEMGQRGRGQTASPLRAPPLPARCRGPARVSADAKADPRDWLPGERTLASRFQFPLAGTRGLHAGAGARGSQRPAPPLPPGDGRARNEGRYELSKVKVE